MASPISPLEAIKIVQKCVALYNKIQHDVPEQVQEVGKQMRRLGIYLQSTEDLLNDKSQHVLATTRPAETKEIGRILDEIRDKSKEVFSILERWKRNEAFGVIWKFDGVAQALFAIGSSPSRLQDLTDNIDKLRMDLHYFLSNYGQHAINYIINNQKLPTVVPFPQPPNFQGRKSVIFVDPNNLGRSVVAEAYCQLLCRWTSKAGKEWPVHSAHSAGVRVKNQSDCVEAMVAANPKIVMGEGGATPVPTAMDSLFDNGLFNYPFKSEVRTTYQNHHSRGIHKDIFNVYDFIVIFVNREREVLLRLKQALRGKHGEDIAPLGKGRIVHLGFYLKTKDGKAKNIVDAAKAPDGSHNRANWNQTTSEIKVAIKEFLKQELGWEDPGKRTG